MEIRYQNLLEIDQIAQKIITFATENENRKKIKVWLFEGEMGAGKTTLIKAICKQLEVSDTVQSPTFSLVNQYQTQKNETIYHFDFYRIKDETEAMDMGYEEYFYDDKYCFVEWASKIPSLIPDKHLKISIFLELTDRLIVITEHEQAI